MAGLAGMFTGQPASPGVNSAPQGLLDLILGTSNPVAQFADSHQNVLGAIGAGLGSQPDFGNALGAAAQNIPQARKADYQTGLYKGQVSQTVAYLQKTHPELAQAVASGVLSPADAFQQAFTLDNPTGVVSSPGSVLRNPRTGEVMGGGNQQPGFYSTDMKSQAWNTVMRANAPGADPSLKSGPDFQASWAIVTEPTMTPQGMMQPNVPQGWGPNAAPAAGTAPPTSGAPAAIASPVSPAGGASVDRLPMYNGQASTMPMITPPAQVTRGPGIIPGTQPYNESQARLGYLTNSSIPDVKRVVDGYPSLMNTKDQLLSKFGDVGRVFQSPEYKQAADAMQSSMGNMLWFASGANIAHEEANRKASDYMPKVNDDPVTAANKLERFSNDVMGMANETKDPDTIKWATQAVSGIKATEDKMLGKGASPDTSGGPPTAINRITGQRLTLINGAWQAGT